MSLGVCFEVSKSQALSLPSSLLSVCLSLPPARSLPPSCVLPPSLPVSLPVCLPPSLPLLKDWDVKFPATSPAPCLSASHHDGYVHNLLYWLVNLTQAKVIREEGASTEERPP